MSITYEFANARAEECARDAESAQLENVRERALRSETAWRAMASRALHTEAARKKREAEAGQAQSVA